MTISSGLDDADLENERLFEKLGNTPEAWHALIAKTSGAMSIRITRGSAPRAEIETWIKRLNFVSKKMKQFVKEKTVAK